MDDFCRGAFQDHFKVFRPVISLAHFEQKAGEVTHHVFQKTATAHPETKGFLISPKPAFKNGSHFRLARIIAFIGAAKSSEVVLANQARRSLDHGSFVEWIGMVVDVTTEKWWAHLFAPDPVLISLGYSLEAGMEVLSALQYLRDPDIARQEAVERLAQVIGGNWILEVKGSADCHGVYTCIGSSTSFDMDRLPFNLRQRYLDRTLDRW